MPGKEFDPTWNDDGSMLFFVGETPKGSNQYQVYLLETGTKQIIQLTSSPGSIRHLSWTSLPALPPDPNALQTPAEPETNQNNGNIQIFNLQNLNDNGISKK